MALEPVAESTSATCPSCQGVWVPRSSLPSGERGGLFRSLLGGFAPIEKDSPLRTCPECGTETLEQVGRSGFEIARCGKCQGVWLDAGVLEKLRTEIGARWAPFLTQAFGKGLGSVLQKG